MPLPDKLYVTENHIDDSPWFSAQLTEVEAVENYDGTDEDAPEVGVYKLVKVSRLKIEQKVVEVV